METKTFIYKITNLFNGKIYIGKTTNKNPRNRWAKHINTAKHKTTYNHAYHLVRLIRMCREILMTGKVIVKRPDREELLAIRNGAWSYEKLIDFAESEEKSLNELYNQSNVLPKVPDREKLDRLCIDLIETSLRK